MDATYKELTTLLKNRNLKVTSNRLEVLSLIAGYSSAIPYSLLQKSLEDFDRVTLYRILKTLLDKGIIHKASVSRNEVYYALCKQFCNSEEHNHNHIHFKCLKCNSVSCVDVPSDISIQIPNALIQEIDIQVKGLCSACNYSN